jgi:hypothetical protein
MNHSTSQQDGNYRGGGKKISKLKLLLPAQSKKKAKNHNGHGCAGQEPKNDQL